jgi:Avidin family
MTTLAQENARWLGTWRNERRSVLRIRNIVQIVLPGGSGTPQFQIDGTYETMKGSVPATERFPVAGFVTEDQIVFSASFRYVASGTQDDDSHSLTTWAGQILPLPEDPDRQALQTLWHLVPSLKEGGEEDGYGWMIAWAGEDRFTRLSESPDFNIPED